MTEQERIENTRQLLAEEHSFTSFGDKIKYAVDHFGMSLSEIHEYSTALHTTDAGLVDVLIMYEQNNGGDVEQAVISAMEQADAQVLTDKKQRFAKYMAESNDGYAEAFEHEIEESGKRDYIMTGFNQLDSILGGGLREGLYVVGAIPSLGKTTWVLQMSDYIASHGKDSIIVSLEMSRFDLMARSISRLTMLTYPDVPVTPFQGKTAMQILDGRRYFSYSDEDKRLIERAKAEYAKYSKRVRVIEGKGDVKVSDISEAVDKHIEITGNVPLLVLDYLQLLAPYDPRASDKQNMDKAVLEMRRIARDYHCPVIVISSFNRQNYNRKVSYESFKESGGIEYCADAIIGLQLRGVGDADFDVDEAKQQNPREVEAVILKNRFGQTGNTVPFMYDAAHNLFRERKEYYD